MPDKNARIALVSSLISKHGSPLSRKDLDKVALLTDGYTCSDITNLARDAAMAPLREISTAELVKIKPEEMRSINIKVSFSSKFSCSEKDKSLNKTLYLIYLVRYKSQMKPLSNFNRIIFSFILIFFFRISKSRVRGFEKV